MFSRVHLGTNIVKFYELPKNYSIPPLRPFCEKSNRTTNLSTPIHNLAISVQNRPIREVKKSEVIRLFWSIEWQRMAFVRYAHLMTLNNRLLYSLLPFSTLLECACHSRRSLHAIKCHFHLCEQLAIRRLVQNLPIRTAVKIGGD